MGNIPLAVNKRLCKISSNERVFKEAAPDYQEALNKSGYTHTLVYSEIEEPPKSTNKQNRKRKETWFNPPWNSAVKTNVGKKFLRILDISFPPDNPLRKILNRNTVKIGYKCMPNMGSLVSTHNTRLLMEDNLQQLQGCNCLDGPTTCPLTPPECQKDNVIYVASVSTQNNTEHYTGLTGDTFKKRWSAHKTTFNSEKEKNKTTLSTYIWKLKEEGKVHDINPIPPGTPPRRYRIKWDIMDRATTFNSVSRKCRLCLKEIFYIMFKPESATLNSRNELYNTCRLRKQKLLNPKK